MLTVTATLRRFVDAPAGPLVSLQELAAYYPVRGAVADFFRAAAPGTRVTFTHDLHLVIAEAAVTQ